MNPNRPHHPSLARSLPLLFTLPFAVGAAAGDTAAPARPAPAAPPGTTRLQTIGVIGGIGPQATMDFEARVHRVSQRLVPANFNSAYPPLVVYFHRRPPVVVDDTGHPIPPLRPDPQLLEAAARIGPMVDFLVITSNGAHKIAPEIERVAGKPVLSMVDRVVDEVTRRGWRKVGLMTLASPAIYSEPLAARGIAVETLKAEQQAALDREIFHVMEGRDDEASHRVALEALADLRRRGVDGVILGCTEVPFLVGQPDGQPDLINPIQLLAEAAVERAMRQNAAGERAMRQSASGDPPRTH